MVGKLEDAKTQLDVKLEGETVWLNRQQLAELFGRDVKAIDKHINNTLKEELNDGISTVAKFATVQTEGGKNCQSLGKQLIIFYCYTL